MWLASCKEEKELGVLAKRNWFRMKHAKFHPSLRKYFFTVSCSLAEVAAQRVTFPVGIQKTCSATLGNAILQPCAQVEACDEWCSQRFILGLVIFIIFMSEIDSVMECTLNKSDDDTKLRGATDTTDGRDVIQRDRNKLEMEQT